MGCGEPSAPLSAEQPGPAAAAAECVRACVCVREEDTSLPNGFLLRIQTFAVYIRAHQRDPHHTAD